MFTAVADLFTSPMYASLVMMAPIVVITIVTIICPSAIGLVSS